MVLRCYTNEKKSSRFNRQNTQVSKMDTLQQGRDRNLALSYSYRLCERLRQKFSV